MSKFTVLNKKSNVEGIAVELENGRFEITEAGNTKEVAASTFKRWYKVIAEVVEEVAVEEVVEVVEEVEVQEEQPAQAKPASTRQAKKAESLQMMQALPVNTSREFATKQGQGKCSKVMTKVEFGGYHVVVVEYNNFVCDVALLNTWTDEVEYRSPKMSIKDALEYMGLEGDALKEARKQLMQLKKQCKANA